MTTEEIDREIAEHVGWKLVDVPGYLFNGIQVQMWQDPTGKRGATHPSYSTDLNAMREAEQSLFTRHHDAKATFIDRLCRIMDPVSGYRKQEAIDIIGATAEQHALAFVETISNWRHA